MQQDSRREKPIDISLADGNPLVLTAMSEIFDRDPRFSLVATSSTAEGFLGAVMRVPVRVAVIDWTLPALGGQKLTEVLRDQEGAPQIVIYGDDARGEVARLAMLAGPPASSAGTPPPTNFSTPASPLPAGQMVFPFLDVRELQTDPIRPLTRRERALLEALSKGLSNRELARDFDISANTVKFHLSNLFEKLGVRNRAQAIAFYYSSRLPSEAAARG